MNKYLLIGGGALIGASIVTATLAYKPIMFGSGNNDRNLEHGDYHNGNNSSGMKKGMQNNMHKGFHNLHHGEQSNECYKNGNFSSIEKESLSDLEKEELKYHYAEETMARDVYQYLYKKYDLEVFNNISHSEQMHMNAVGSLLEKYDLEKPEDYGPVKEMYNSLIEKGDKSLKDAIEVGIQIEIKDIQDIVANINSTNIDNKDINTILYKIGGASFNHLRGFLKNLQNQGFETDLDWKQYLSEEDINTKGPLFEKIDNFIDSKENISDILRMHKMHNKSGGMHHKGGGCNLKKGKSDKKVNRGNNMRGKGGMSGNH